jgi:hypothetical protein
MSIPPSAAARLPMPKLALSSLCISDWVAFGIVNQT